MNLKRYLSPLECVILDEPTMETKFWQCHCDSPEGKRFVKVSHRIELNDRPEVGDVMAIMCEQHNISSSVIAQVPDHGGFCWIAKRGASDAMFEARRRLALFRIKSADEELNSLVNQEQLKLFNKGS